MIQYANDTDRCESNSSVNGRCDAGICEVKRNGITTVVGVETIAAPEPLGRAVTRFGTARLQFSVQGVSHILLSLNALRTTGRDGICR